MKKWKDRNLKEQKEKHSWKKKRKARLVEFGEENKVHFKDSC